VLRTSLGWKIAISVPPLGENISKDVSHILYLEDVTLSQGGSPLLLKGTNIQDEHVLTDTLRRIY